MRAEGESFHFSLEFLSAKRVDGDLHRKTDRDLSEIDLVDERVDLQRLRVGDLEEDRARVESRRAGRHHFSDFHLLREHGAFGGRIDVERLERAAGIAHRTPDCASAARCITADW